MARMARILSRTAQLATMLLAGCTAMNAGPPGSAAPRPAGEPLAGEWRVEDIDGTGVAAGSELSIAFAPDGGVTGSAGCNRFFGRYAMEGADLRFSGLGTTKRACEPELMRQETRFLTGLGATRMLERLPDGSLALLGEGRGKLLLRRAGGAPGPVAPPVRSGRSDRSEESITGGFGHLYCPG